MEGQLQLYVPEEAIGHYTGAKPVNPVNVTRGVVVYCDPAEFKGLQFNFNPFWRVAVGVHPKTIGDMTEESMDEFHRLLADPRVAAVGEVGLDRTCPQSAWEPQEKFLEEVLGLGCLGRVLVLHVRGSRHDKNGKEVYAKCLDIVKRQCTRHQRIHLHCFNGCAKVLKAWSSHFPNCFFGFTSMVRSFTLPQREALRNVRPDRLLLETDSPYFPMQKDQSINTPAFIGDVAAEVALLRMTPTQEIIRQTDLNGRNLYGFHTSQ
jgi:TatD DNase family protein